MIRLKNNWFRSLNKKDLIKFKSFLIIKWNNLNKKIMIFLKDLKIFTIKINKQICINLIYIYKESSNIKEKDEFLMIQFTLFQKIIKMTI